MSLLFGQHQDLDDSEQRYLLSGAGDGSIGVYDTLAPDGLEATKAEPPAEGAQAPPSHCRRRGPSSRPRRRHSAVLRLGRGAGHMHSVSALAWCAGVSLPASDGFLQHTLLHLLRPGRMARNAVASFGRYPVDTGLFFSGGFDNVFCVWDANAGAPVTRISLDAKASGPSHHNPHPPPAAVCHAIHGGCGAYTKRTSVHTAPPCTLQALLAPKPNGQSCGTASIPPCTLQALLATGA